MCMIEYGDGPEFWHEKSQTARKEHRCDECSRQIRRGEVYWYAFGKCDGYTYEAKTCSHCRVACEWLNRNCHGFVYQAVIEDFGEHAEDNLPMLRIVVGARRQWQSFADPSRLLPVPADPPDMHA